MRQIVSDHPENWMGSLRYEVFGLTQHSVCDSAIALPCREPRYLCRQADRLLGWLLQHPRPVGDPQFMGGLGDVEVVERGTRCLSPSQFTQPSGAQPNSLSASVCTRADSSWCEAEFPSSFNYWLTLTANELLLPAWL
jgi:hypothetical protein